MAYSQGGGGGRAVNIGENDIYALDKPFDAINFDSINELLNILFRNVTKAKAEIDAIVRTNGVSDIKISTLDLTNTQISTLNTVPVIHIAGQVGKIIIPIWWTMEWDTTVVYTSAPNWRVRFTGNTTDLFATFTSRLNSLFHVVTHSPGPTAGINWEVATADDIVGTAVQLQLSADPTGTGNATAVSRIGYYVIDATY